MLPHVAAWLHACSQWDAAIATKEHECRNTRRKLCREHGIPLTQVVNTNKDLEKAMMYIRRHFTNRIMDIRAQTLLRITAREPSSAHAIQQRAVSADTTVDPPCKKTKPSSNKLDNYFTRRAASDARPEIQELDMPDVATDVRSTFLLLRAKKKHLCG